MSPEDFDRLQSLMASRAGFRLTRDRMKLAEHRLGPLARRARPSGTGDGRSRRATWVQTAPTSASFDVRISPSNGFIT